MSKTEKMVDNQVRFRAADTLLAELVERRTATDLLQQEGIGWVARRDLHRYYGLLRVALPQFAEPEGLLIIEALAGQGSSEHGARMLWAHIEEAIENDGLDEKYGVDREALVRRLRRDFNRIELMAIVDAAERAWGHMHTAPRMDAMAAARKVGLVPEGDYQSAEDLAEIKSERVAV